MTEEIGDGLYESLRTRRLERRLRALPDGAARFADIDQATAPDVLARHVADVGRRVPQNATSAGSGTGRRSLDGTSHVLLFVRQARVDAFGEGAPFLCLGRVSLVEHHGERPIAITWRLARPMPVEILQAGAVDAA